MENEIQKPLTLEQLIKYNQEVFLPAIEYRFNKIDNRLDGIDGRLDGIDDRLDGIDDRLDGMDDRFNKIDNSIDYLINQVDKLVQENEIRNYQERKQKEFFAILVKDLKDKNILSKASLEKISKLEIF